MGAILGRIIVLPITILMWPFRMIRILIMRALGKKSARTMRKSGGSMVASTQEDHVPNVSASDPTPNLVRKTEHGLKSLLFTQLDRPRLVERRAADLSLDEARQEVEHAKRFYEYKFSLFPRGDFFYEEVEQEYLHDAMGLTHCATDARYIQIMTQFRRVLNDNSRRLFLYYTPTVFFICLAFALAVASNIWPIPVSWLERIGASPHWANEIGHYIAQSGIFLIGLFALLLIYHWPYKVTQQRNLLGLDNYITSKFSRVNQNFLVAKRRSLNVERNKRMSQADELRDEAGVWTLAYNWFATRLLLCEMLVRNKIYQIRRNTTLYSVGGVSVCLLIAALSLGTIAVTKSLSSLVSFAILGLMAAAFILLAYSVIMGRATRDILNVLHQNEWARFNQISLHNTIADHVAEDKLQIVTFRDRNRFE